ncbi:SH3 domain-containing protein [Halomonas sp. M1]|uniref:SH3 domain-containing protein n=1 Tax=Roseinatronobacter sp. S2 TaxID=3035471 RepID=UPI00240F8C6A|nr:SH3 domain-containing protein [Roseinatronobacter sp. S2]
MMYIKYLLVAVMAASPVTALELERGPITNLPLPRYVTMKASEGNARRGPDTSHRVDWVFTRRDLPLRVTAEYEHWRRVEDAEGQGGWMHYALLSGVRSVLVQGDMVQMHNTPDAGSSVAALLERGVIAHLRACQIDWCRLEVDSARGWVEKRHIWGVAADEEF